MPGCCGLQCRSVVPLLNNFHAGKVVCRTVPACNWPVERPPERRRDAAGRNRQTETETAERAKTDSSTLKVTLCVYSVSQNCMGTILRHACKQSKKNRVYWGSVLFFLVICIAQGEISRCDVCVQIQIKQILFDPHTIPLWSVLRISLRRYSHLANRKW